MHDNEPNPFRKPEPPLLLRWWPLLAVAVVVALCAGVLSLKQFNGNPPRTIFVPMTGATAVDVKDVKDKE
jgi:hypothetical protein